MEARDSLAGRTPPWRPPEAASRTWMRGPGRSPGPRGRRRHSCRRP